MSLRGDVERCGVLGGVDLGLNVRGPIEQIGVTGSRNFTTDYYL